MLSDVRFRLRALFRRRALEQELDEELRFHLEHEMEKHVRSGLSRADAKRRSRLSFGGLEVVKEEARDARGVAWLDAVMQDVRYGWRGLVSRPGFTVAVVLTLALGVGVNTMMFGIVDRLLVRPPTYLRAPERVHRVYLRYLWNGRPGTERNLSYPRYLDVSRFTTSFDATAAFDYRQIAVGSGDRTRELTVASVSASLFDFFDARPALGRFYSAEEDRVPTGERLAVLGYGYWQSAFGGNKGVLGQTLHVGKAVHTIIGVAPQGLTGIGEDVAPALFIPITSFAHVQSPGYPRDYGWTWLEMLVRRKPGVGIEVANADLSASHVRSWEEERSLSPTLPSAATAQPRGELGPVHLGRGPQAGADAKVLAWVMGVALIVLVIACANVVNLLLARALHRRREIALRLALGVTRARLLQQLLVESLLIALLGGGLGLALAQWSGGALRALFLRADELQAVASDARTLGFTAFLTVTVALLTGLTPALQAMRADVAATLKAGMRDSAYRSSRLRTGLLLFQGALSVVLLVGAGLFVRSLFNVRSFRLGYDVDPVVYIEGNLRGADLSAAQSNVLADRLLGAALRTTGVRSATLTISVPFWSGEGRGTPFVPGRDSLARLGRYRLQAGSPSYFETMGTRILRGRGFTEEDGATTLPVAVVSQAMASAIWPDSDPLGKQMRIGNDTMPFLTVVGVAEDMRGQTIRGDQEFWYYLPMSQYQARFGDARLSLFARVGGAGKDYVQPLRRRLQAEMPAPGYVNVTELGALVAPQRRSWQFGATMFVAFAALALVLAAIGLYSVITYALAQRTRELGVRIALGATVSNVIRLIVGQGVVFAVAGIILGSAAALLVARRVEPLLFAVSARDPAVYAAVATILLVVAIVATLRPALRATRVDPSITMRAE
jgi:predicted permease